MSFYNGKYCMSKLTINPGCITCGVCEFVAPEVFEVTDICHVKPNVVQEKYADEIQQAIASCPVQVIVYDKSA